MELNPARDVRGNKKSFNIYVGDKRKIRRNVGPLWKETGDLVTQDLEKAKVLSDLFQSSVVSATKRLERVFLTRACSDRKGDRFKLRAGLD